MKQTQRAAAVALAFLFAAPAAAQVRQEQVPPFSEALRCEWTTTNVGNAWTGAIVQKTLSARNTLNHVLPAGTHVTWSYARGGGMLGESGALDLTAPVPRGRIFATGAAFTATAAQTGGGQAQVQTCQIQATYNMRQR